MTHASDKPPTDPATGAPYFQVEGEGYGTGWEAGPVSKSTLSDLFLTIVPSLEPELERCPWPVAGHAYHVIFEVERIDYPDMNPNYDIIHCPDEVSEILSQHDLSDIVGDGCLPIASGLFSCTLTYWHKKYTDWETGHADDDYGFDVTHLRKLPDHP